MEVKRNFCIGSEWLYYKIYTGVKITDTILLEKLYPVIAEFKSEKLIDKWFFIRYKDPQEHLRLRFYSKFPDRLSVVIAKLYSVLNDLLEQDVVWKVQTDTYQRELERYGEITMEDSETLFWRDSELMLQYLTLKPSFVNDEVQLLFSFLAIDSFLNSFSLTNGEKLELLNNLQLAFKKEFDADKTLKKELGKNYRALSIQLDDLINGEVYEEYVEISYVILEKQDLISTTVLKIKAEIQISINSFLSSHIHMIINRQFFRKKKIMDLVI